MTDRGLPLVDGAPACPFVAFEDDRDARATSPDHRHRCYAEVRPAPRALAHQEAYCLSSAFPVCPTFQDWARREAAQARAATQDASSGSVDDRLVAPATPDVAPLDPMAGQADSSQRNPPRNWAAPPPWLSSRDAAPDDGDEPDVEIQPPIRGGGLAGSFADRLAGGTGGRVQPAPGEHLSAPVERSVDDAGAADDGWGEGPGRMAQPRPRRPGRDDRAAGAPALPGPSWERPRRLEAYPTLKTRLGLPSVHLPPLLVGVAALVLGAIALFFLPLLLGVGNDPGAGGATATPGLSALPSGTPAAPTPTPAPTQLIYTVQEGDTMTIIADRFGVPLAALIEANRETIPNPDILQIGQQVVIPAAAPTTLPGVTPTPTPAT
ncbi:MAG: LysM peptidoglycan-binding domain-containing protein [Chloroflexota bacterium]